MEKKKLSKWVIWILSTPRYYCGISLGIVFGFYGSSSIEYVTGEHQNTGAVHLRPSL